MVTASFEALVRSAQQAIAQGRAEEAKHHYSHALAQRPNSPEVHYGLAMAEYLLNDLTSAAFHFKEVTRIDPLRAGAFVNLGAVLNRLGEHREAAQALRRGIQLDPQRAEGYYNLGLVYRAAGDHARAAQAYQEATRIDPHMIDAYFNLGNLLMEDKQYAPAAECYRKALAVQPDWDKATRALAYTEGMLAGLSAAPHQASADPAPAPPADPDRRLDPQTDMPALEALHAATMSAEGTGTNFLHAFSTEVAPSVRELTSALIGQRPGKTVFDLDRRIEKFEQAIGHFRKVHEELQNQLHRAQAAGDRLLK